MEKVKFDSSSMIRGVEVINGFPDNTLINNRDAFYRG